MTTPRMSRVDALRKSYAGRRNLDVREVRTLPGATLVRVAWTQQTLSGKGNSEDRTIVMWFGYIADEYVASDRRKASVVDLLRHVMTADEHGNVVAREGLDRCDCGCKYWQRDRCVDCGSPPPPRES